MTYPPILVCYNDLLPLHLLQACDGPDYIEVGLILMLCDRAPMGRMIALVKCCTQIFARHQNSQSIG